MPRRDLNAAHRHSGANRVEIGASQLAGCFHCCRTFVPSEIRQWTDPTPTGIGQTAVCPYCQVDAVIGSASGYLLTEEFLRRMQQWWFENRRG